MGPGTCEKKDCTVAVTGKCLLNPSATECPHFRPAAKAPTAAEVPGTAPAKAVTSTPPPRTFHSGQELGTRQAAELMTGRYAHLIGILGAVDAGKTCFLSSLYLLASNRLAAPEYAFAGSLTLQGFDDRARLLRTWKDGILPEKLAEHTTLADPRSPGFLHIALQNRIGRRLDLLLTDLPGEWTKALINRADTAARFEFLKRADGLLVVLDGPALESNEKRHSEVQRHRLLLQRLRDDVGVSTSVPLVLVVSKSDRLTTGETPAAANDLMRWATELGFSPRLVRVAAFSASAG